MRICDDVVTKLTYLNKELGKDERLKYESHLESCKNCRREYEENAAIAQVLQHLPTHVVPEVILTQTRTALRNAAVNRAILSSPRSSRFLLSYSATAIVTSLFALALLLSSISGSALQSFEELTLMLRQNGLFLDDVSFLTIFSLIIGLALLSLPSMTESLHCHFFWRTRPSD